MRVLNISNDYFYTKLYKKFHLNLINKGIDSVFLVPTSFNTIHKHKHEDQKVIILPSFRIWWKPFFRVKYNLVIKKLYLYFNNNLSNFDIIHAHYLFSAGIIAREINKRFGIPYVVTVRNTDINYVFKRMIHLRRTGISILNRASKIIFLSNAYKESTLRFIPDSLKKPILDKSVIIPNGIDEFWFHNLNTEKKIDSRKDIKFLQVGEITKNKNYLTTVRAMELLKKEGFNPTLSVAGKIKNKKIYKTLVSYEFVSNHGLLPKEDLLKLYRANDIFILPSIHETFGLVYAEAMSQGLPIIYTKGQGFDQQFKEGTVGFHVESQSDEDILKAIRSIIERYDTLSQNCIREVYKFDWESITKRYIQLYKEICE